MIVEIMMYTVKCDNCGEQFSYDEFAGFTDFGYALDMAYNSGWNTEDKHYCPDCWELDDEDNVVVITK